MTQSNPEGGARTVIKKYANRRLYNTATSSYVTLDHLCDMVKSDEDFVVYDAKTGEDITRSVLTQIIFEQEGKGKNLLPIGFLRQLISFYDDSLRTMVPGYLEQSLEAFARNQEQIRQYVAETYGEFPPVKQAQEWGLQNVALFQQALEMLNPYAAALSGESPAPESREHPARQAGETDPSGDAPKAAPAAGEPDQPVAEISALKAQLNAMQRQIDALTRIDAGDKTAGDGSPDRSSDTKPDPNSED